jgi:DNA-directed RNA polymerase subunit RPC12/RpoP
LSGYICPKCKKETLILITPCLVKNGHSVRCKNCNYAKQNINPKSYKNPKIEKDIRKKYIETLIYSAKTSGIKEFKNKTQFIEFLNYWQIPKKYNTLELIKELNKILKEKNTTE